MISQENTISIAALLQKTTYVIDVFKNEDDYERTQVYTSGSGVAITETGDLITAAHVLKIKPEEATGKEIIVARTEDLPPVSYSIVLNGLTINLPLLRTPLKVDLAYLRPISPRKDAPFIKIKKEFSSIGTMVLMSGYPDEVEPALSFDQHIDYTLPALVDPNHETAKKRHMIRQQLMIKSGMIGSARPASFNLIDKSTFTLAAYYIDNGMNPGASGGPVVNMQGELVATISQRAETTTVFSEHPVPSGSTLAISSWAIVNILQAKGVIPVT